MFDEYMDDEKGARAALHESVAALGEDVATSRARARVFWRHNKHHDAVEILRDIAHLIGRDSQIDRAFALREGAISAASRRELFSVWARCHLNRYCWSAKVCTPALRALLLVRCQCTVAGLDVNHVVLLSRAAR
jgi:hypothetical protein